MLENVLRPKPPVSPRIRRQQTVAVKTLKSGATLLMKNDYHLPTTAVRAVFLGGLLFENKKNNGISQLLSATMVKGSKKHSATEISREIEMMGGVLKSDVGRNSINLGLDILSRNLLSGLEIFMEVLLHPTFEAHMLESEKTVLMADIAASLDHPMQEAFKIFLKVFYGEHPYGQDLLGTSYAVKSLTSKKLSEYHQNLMNPKNMVVSLVGQFDMNAAMEKIDEQLQGLKLPANLLRIPQNGKLEFKKDVHRNFKLKKRESQTHILWAYPGVTFKDEHRHSIEILNSVLSGQSGKLFYRLRDELSLAYHVSSTSVEGLDRGHLVIYMATDPGKVDLAIDEIQKIIDQLRHDSLSDEEIRKAKKIMIGSFENEMQLSAMQALYLGYYQLYGLGHEVLDTYVETVEKLPHARVRQDISDFLAQPRVLTIFSPQ
jgi:zinc protease